MQLDVLAFFLQNHKETVLLKMTISSLNVHLDRRNTLYFLDYKPLLDLCGYHRIVFNFSFSIRCFNPKTDIEL